MTKKLLQQALDALKIAIDYTAWAKSVHQQSGSAIAALEAAITQPTPAEYAQGYCEGFEDACKPAQPAVGDVKIAELRAVIEALLPFFDGVQDEGLPGEGWKSDALVAAIQNAEAVLAGTP